jgi:hypothetical protein
LWILNLATCGLGGVQMRFMGRIGWGYRSVSRGFRGSFIVILDWRLVMALQLDVWCGDQVLEPALPKLFILAHYKDASTTNHLEFSSYSH